MQSTFLSETICVLEANLDDLSPQIISYATEKLFELGALDVVITPVLMKKGRSGHLLTVICKPEERDKFIQMILRETSTLGVRSHLCERFAAEREWQAVTLDDQMKIRIKIGRDCQGNLINAQPEYEDCVQYAQLKGLPLKSVLLEAISKFNAEKSAAAWSERS